MLFDAKSLFVCIAEQIAEDKVKEHLTENRGLELNGLVVEDIYKFVRLFSHKHAWHSMMEFISKSKDCPQDPKFPV